MWLSEDISLFDTIKDKIGSIFARKVEMQPDFYKFPVEVLERGGIYLPDHISVEFKKEQKSRPKVIVYENGSDKKRKILELKLIMVAEE